MYAGSKYESHYTVWTAWISIRARVRVRVYFILQDLAPPGTTVHVPTARWRPFCVIRCIFIIIIIHGSDVYLGMSPVQNGGSYLMY